MSKKLSVEYVYAGAMLHNDVVVHSYIHINTAAEPPTLGDAVVYAKKMSKHGVGSVIKFVAIDTPDNLVSTTGQFQRVWPNRIQVAEWTAMSDAITTSEDAYTAALGKPSALLEPLDSIRSAYAKLGKREGAILLGRICAYIVDED